MVSAADGVTGKVCLLFLLLLRMADTTKQGVGMLGVHFVNLFLSQLLPTEHADPCIM